MAKVEQRHRELAEEALGHPEVLFQGEYDDAAASIAQAIADAEQRGAASQPRQGGADGREVWVVERDGKPFTACAGSKESVAKLFTDTIIRYVPAESRQRQASGWVPVAERLPETGQGVVLLGMYGDGETRFYHPCTFADAVRRQFGDAWDDVTHWMPLPPPPAEESKP